MLFLRSYMLGRAELTHDWRLHNPVTLYSFLQKFWFLVVLSLKEHCDCKISRSQQRLLLSESAYELLVDDLPDDFVRRHLD